MDHRRHPAGELVALYHERWEIESAFYSLRHTLLDVLVLRSYDSLGVQQEVWAQLTLYQILRRTMVEAAESVPGADPDRVSFTVALEAAREQVITAQGVPPDPAQPALIGAVGRTVLDNLLPRRRPRIAPRRVLPDLPLRDPSG